MKHLATPSTPQQQAFQEVLKELYSISTNPDTPQEQKDILEKGLKDVQAAYALKMFDPDYEAFSFSGASFEESIDTTDEVQVTVSRYTYVNQGNDPIEPTYTKRVTFTDSFTFGFTEGLKVGASAEFGINAGIVSASVSMNTELSFTAEQSKTQEQQVFDQVSVPVPVPPRSQVEVKVCCDQVAFQGTYVATFRPEFSADFRQLDPIAGRSFQTVFPGVNIVVSQKGTISGQQGLNWSNVIGQPQPLPSADG